MFLENAFYTKNMAELPSISKVNVHLLCNLLRDYGIRHIVVSSGSRCAPVSVTLSRMRCFVLHPVIDERSAAFIALGIALATDEPVAMVCTSGSAPLNFGPALAEAYYRRIPLVAITADRPLRCVGQRVGQTIRQAGALSAVTRCCVDIPECGNDKKSVENINKLINDALATCTGTIKGPVQINIRLESPLTPTCTPSALPTTHKDDRFSQPDASLENIFSGIPAHSPRIMLFIGGVRLSDDDIKALIELQATANVAIVAEAQSNIPDSIRPMHLDRILDKIPVPDVVAFIGGDLISNRFKTWLNSLTATYFISGGYEDDLVVPFNHLDKHVECRPANFFKALAKLQGDKEYPLKLQDLASEGKKVYRLDAKPVAIFQALVDTFQGNVIHVSNGTSARIIQLIELRKDIRLEINRGVSGIDGSSSTAIGDAIANEIPTLLITGDMSAAYDIGALATLGMPSNFKMAVLDNGGGDIFRNISTTSSLPELDELFVMKPVLPLKTLAEAYGFAYYECYDVSSDTLTRFINHEGPSMLHIKVNPEDCAGLL